MTTTKKNTTKTATAKGKGKTPAPTAKGKGKKTPAPAPTAKGKGKAKETPAPAPAPTAPTPRVTKKGEAMALLAKGVTLETLMNTFGWQRHTVRGFISILGKTHKIESTSVEGARTYKIAAKGDK